MPNRTILRATVGAVLTTLLTVTAVSSAMAADLPGDYTRDGVNIRTDTSGGRDVPIVGQGQLSHAITIHCYVNGGRPVSEPSTGNAGNL